MAENSVPPSKRSPPPEDLGHDGPPNNKILKVETETEVKPPPREYKEIRKLLRSINNQASKSEKDKSKILSLLSELKQLCLRTVSEGELPPAVMVIQMHLKNTFFNSEGIKDGDNIKTFLSGVEDGSEGRSDQDDSVYVFYANHATALWYRWDEASQRWQWTPESKHWLWMPCSTTKVTDGQWKGEIPAPENVEIIHYLDTVRPVPSEEVYLAEQYSLATLLTDLAAVDGLREGVAAIAALLQKQELSTEDQAGHLKAFKEAMSKLLEPVE